MDEEKVDKIIDILHDSKDLVKDVAKPVCKDVGGILSTFTGFFKNVVLYPLKCLNSKFEQKAIAFERKMQEKYNNIPENDRVEPPVNIVGPTLESLKYNIDEDYMQELFANLLTSSMDRKTKNLVHPKYVQVISAMNEIDAKVFKFLTKKYVGYIKSGKVNVGLKGTDKIYVGALPDWVIPDNIQGINIFEVSKSLIRLSNFGLIDLMYDRTAGDSILKLLYNKIEIQNVLNAYINAGLNVELRGTDCIISVNDDGRNFAKIVLKD